MSRYVGFFYLCSSHGYRDDAPDGRRPKSLNTESWDRFSYRYRWLPGAAVLAIRVDWYNQRLESSPRTAVSELSCSRHTVTQSVSQETSSEA
jgi:hypothetical protein